MSAPAHGQSRLCFRQPLVHSGRLLLQQAHQSDSLLQPLKQQTQNLCLTFPLTSLIFSGFEHLGLTDRGMSWIGGMDAHMLCALPPSLRYFVLQMRPASLKEQTTKAAHVGVRNLFKFSLRHLLTVLCSQQEALRRSPIVHGTKEM